MFDQKKYAYTYAGVVQLGKFSVVVVDTGTYAKDGFALPGAQNAANPIGIVEEGIVPWGASDYAKGSYENISQAAWPGNVQPSSPQGIKRSVVIFGRIRARAAGAINRGDRLIAADNQGHVASVVTLGLPAGTAINVVGIADEPAVNVGDVFQIIVNPHPDKV